MERNSVHLEGTELVRLDNPGRLIWVAHGVAMVFAAPVLADGSHGPRRWLAEVPAGGLIPGFIPTHAPPAHAAFVSALGSADLTLLEGPSAQAWYAGSEQENIRRIEDWLRNLPKPCVKPSPHLTDDAQARLAAPGEMQMAQGQVCVNSRNVLWIKVTAGQALWWGSQTLDADDAKWVPLSPDAWVEALGDCTLQVQRTEGIDDLNVLLRGLALHDSLLLESLEKEEGRESEQWWTNLRD
jgi:hypothetical protein